MTGGGRRRGEIGPPGQGCGETYLGVLREGPARVRECVRSDGKPAQGLDALSERLVVVLDGQMEDTGGAQPLLAPLGRGLRQAADGLQFGEGGPAVELQHVQHGQVGGSGATGAGRGAAAGIRRAFSSSGSSALILRSQLRGRSGTWSRTWARRTPPGSTTSAGGRGGGGCSCEGAGDVVLSGPLSGSQLEVRLLEIVGIARFAAGSGQVS